MKPSCLRGFLLGAVMCAATASFAQEYPAKAVRVLIPWPAGGPTDVIGRLMVNKLSESLGQPFVVENKGGASGMIGSEAVAKAPPDGYTLLLNSGSTQVVYAGLFKSMSFDPVADFVPIGIVGSTPVVVVANPMLAARDMKELIAYARSKPGALNLAIPGAGTLPHLVSELVNSTAGISMTMVPYKGTPPALTDVLSGNAHLTYVAIATALPLIASGKVRALGITSAKRVPALPNVPTLSEAGLADLEVSTWYGLWAPKGTPERIADRLNREIAKTARDEGLRARYAEIATVLEPMSAERFAKFFDDESRRWMKVLASAKVKPE